jgi:hypothetical protein
MTAQMRWHHEEWKTAIAGDRSRDVHTGMMPPGARMWFLAA